MKYLCLVYLSPENWNACPDSICAEYAKTLQDNGKLLGGTPLHPTSTATTVRLRNGQVSVTDGPFAETKEAVGGFYVVDCGTRDEALELAGNVPPSPGVAVEVLTIADV